MLYICESWAKCTSEECVHKVKHHRLDNCENGCLRAKRFGMSSRCIPFSKRLTNIRW